MGKDGKSRFFSKNIRHFYPIKKKTLEKKFVIELYQILIINHKTDFSSAHTNIFKSRCFVSNNINDKKINFFLVLFVVMKSNYKRIFFLKFFFRNNFFFENST